MSIFILFENNHIKNEYHHIIILDHHSFALKTFFPKDHVIFSTNNGIFFSNQKSQSLSNKSFDSDFIVDKTKQTFHGFFQIQSIQNDATASISHIFFTDIFALSES
jgi:predicted HAD superfamily hydrolase